MMTILRCRNTWQLLVIAVWKLDVSLLNEVAAVHVAILMRRRVEGGSGEVVGGELGRPISLFDGKDEKQTVVGVMPVNIPSSGPGEQQEPIHVLPSKSALWWILLCSSTSTFSFSLPHHPMTPADIPGMLAGIIGLMSLIHKFSHGHQGIPKLTGGFYGIVGVGIIIYLLGIMYTSSTLDPRESYTGLLYGV
jgi:hypothetical protein